MPPAVADPEALTPVERDLVESVANDEPWALVERFAELERVSGTDDEVAAADYVCDRLDALEISYDRYEPELYVSRPLEAAIRPQERTFDHGPLKTVAFSASTTVEGPVEYVGSAGGGLLADDDDPREPYHDVDDLDGAVALTAAGSLSIRATRVLAEKGASGVIAIHEHEREPHDGIATPVWGGAPPYDERDRIPDVPVVNVCKPDGDTLREWAERDAGLAVELSTELETGWTECPLVVAEIEGEDHPTDDFVLLHGHYDSWAVGVTDNATGDAGLLEAARVFDAHAEDLRRNLRVAWWPAHSTGRYAGSTWYADEFAHDIADHCVAHANMDSPGAADATEYTDMSCWCPEAHDLVGDAIDAVADAPYEEHAPHRAGDYSFDNLGVTGFFMLSSNIPTEERERRGYHTVGGCGGNSDAWHLSTDTLDKAGRDELVRDIRVYVASVARVLTAEVLPFDHRRTVQKLRERVAHYDDVAGDRFDITPTRERLAELANALGEFEDAVADGRVDPTRANEAITSLSRVLTRLFLVERGQFRQDPATGRQAMPRYSVAEKYQVVDDEAAGFVTVQLRREQNEVVRELDRALSVIPDG